MTMAGKGNQQRNGDNRHASNHKKKLSDSVYASPDMKGQCKTSEVNPLPGDKIINGNQPSRLSTDKVGRADTSGDDNIMKQDAGTFHRKEEQGMDGLHDLAESATSGRNYEDCSSHFVENSSVIKENRAEIGLGSGKKHTTNRVNRLLSGFHVRNMMGNVDFPGNVAVGNLRASILSMLKATGDWLERHKPFFSTVTSNLYSAHITVKLKVEWAYPVVLNWLIRFGNLMVLLSMFWLDLTLRGIYSFLQLGTASYFSVIWCSTMSGLVMAGTFKFLFVLVVALYVGIRVGLILGLLVVAVSGIIFLWLYGSFWTTISIVIIGVMAFMLSHARLTLLITTVYSVYCAWTYVGWLGLFLTLNLSFLSSDILIYFLENNRNHQRRSNPSEPAAGMEGQPGFYNGESFYPASSETGPGLSSDHTPGVPSTSGIESELSSEEEVIRLLNCADHYSVLGLPRYEDVDVSLLKREYRKKAMLVHPDKNMGNERAAEAFKKLQNAYEVLLDSLQREVYDEELRREEVLNYFRRFQSTSHQNGQHGFFASGFTPSEAEGEDPFRESKPIACKKCNNFHVWIHTKKSKSRARWCQDCKDFHQAKDGDGWVEQSSQPTFFGLLQKVGIPSAYVCADSKIYDASEWYTCQGMRCPPNTHKPSFHVNTSITSKHNNTGKGSSNSRQRSGRPAAEKNMTEDEFFEWLQNAVQAGLFDNFNATTSAAERGPSGNILNPKGGVGGGNNNKRKKKGKRQW